ncbi:hypothetical protein [Streptococcus pyogenes]|uniref:hypothetical protein n=1 Tax=Streptococcus pyogenes TaxID=1314 RepID=UPI0011E831C9|nr:hypothetical protein [Streptococcus pyogenes]TYK83647.1 hypothetical protein E0F64_10110 [Streptococcus pyogenes]
MIHNYEMGRGTRHMVTCTIFKERGRKGKKGRKKEKKRGEEREKEKGKRRERRGRERNHM